MEKISEAIDFAKLAADGYKKKVFVGGIAASLILFVISMGMSSKIAGEQQAAIYSRHLDALDAKIEQEYLENAILGKCPAEITQLTRPLPAHMNNDLRQNIAAAAVEKPVNILARGPNRAGTPSEGETVTASTGGTEKQSGAIRGSYVNPRAGSQPMEMSPAVESPQTSAKSAGPTTPKPATQREQARPGNSKFLLIIIAFLAVALTALAIIHFRPSHAPQSLPEVAATSPVNTQPVQPTPVPQACTLCQFSPSPVCRRSV